MNYLSTPRPGSEQCPGHGKTLEKINYFVWVAPRLSLHTAFCHVEKRPGPKDATFLHYMYITLGHSLSCLWLRDEHSCQHTICICVEVQFKVCSFSNTSQQKQHRNEKHFCLPVELQFVPFIVRVKLFMNYEQGRSMKGRGGGVLFWHR